MIDEKQHNLEFSLADESVWVTADKTRMVLILANLVSNAVKYTESKGMISVAVERSPHEAIIRVADTGIGIPPTKLESICELFTQLDRTLEQSQGGLGIGLAIVKRMVELHNGTITALSQGLGKGTEFVVRLSLAATITESNASNSPEAAASSSRRILVVDDNVDAGTSLAMMLRLMGHHVESASNGVQGLRLAKSLRPDVIFLDIGMPGLNGYDVCFRLRNQGWSQSIVIVALTGWGQAEDRERSKEMGFDAHLVKPAKPDELAETIARFTPA